MSEPACPKCQSEFTYADGALWVCPQCGHEWSEQAPAAGQAAADTADDAIRDAHGNPLADGDTVTVIKDLKVKGASSALKAGTKVKGIRLVPDSSDGHNIACKIDGFGAMNLKSEFVKKS
jgi:protein PhnA